MVELIKNIKFTLASISVNVLLGIVLFVTYSGSSLGRMKRLQSILIVKEAGIHGIEEPVSNFDYTDMENWRNSIDIGNATSIFNVVHGAVKQKNANLNPVGVSFIPAYIPPNTLLYHSTSSNSIPDSLEWIAMDYEFSYDFAHFPTIKGKGQPEHHDNDKIYPPQDFSRISNTALESERLKSSSGNYLEENRGFHGFPGGPGGPDGPGKGRFPPRQFLYTFRSKVPLDKLIFLDGASAAKSNTGEMDQQLILSRQKDVNERVNERDSSKKICEWGKKFGLQGVIRLEIGFEIILCDFHDNIELVSNTTLNNVTELISFPYDQGLQDGLSKERIQFLNNVRAMSGLEHLEAGNRVNDGDPRILLDFSKMVTPINKTWIDPDPYSRRINNLTWEMKESLISDLENNLKSPVNPYGKTDWQSLANFMVEKFGPMLVNLNNSLSNFEFNQGRDLSSSLKTASESLTRLTYNFVRRYSDDSIEDEYLKRQKAINASLIDYVYNTYPIRTEMDRLIYSSFLKIQESVSKTIFDSFDVGKEILQDFYVHPTSQNFDKFRVSLSEQRRSLTELIDSLHWSIFTDCKRKCGWDEVCYIPTWGPGPLGFPNDKDEKRWFVFDGKRYRIKSDLECVTYHDANRPF